MINRRSDRTMRRTDAAFYHPSQTRKTKSPKTVGGNPPPLPEILQHCGGNPPPPSDTSQTSGGNPLPPSGTSQTSGGNPPSPSGTPQTYSGRSAKTTVGFFLPPMIEGS